MRFAEDFEEEFDEDFDNHNEYSFTFNSEDDMNDNFESEIQDFESEENVDMTKSLQRMTIRFFYYIQKEWIKLFIHSQSSRINDTSIPTSSIMSNSAVSILTINPSIDIINIITPISMNSNDNIYPSTPSITSGNSCKHSIDHLLPEINTNQSNHISIIIEKYLSNKIILNSSSSIFTIIILTNCESMQKDVISDEYTKYLINKKITKHQLKNQLNHVQYIIKISKFITFKYLNDMKVYKKSRDEIFKIIFAYKSR